MAVQEEGLSPALAGVIVSSDSILKNRHLATVGALVIIFTNLIGTFSQLIIAYPYRWKYDENKILLSTSNHFTCEFPYKISTLIPPLYL